MTWDAAITTEIADTFASLVVWDPYARHGFSVFGTTQHTSPIHNRQREKRRTQRILLDPEYAERRKRQTARAYRRWKKRQAKRRAA